MIRALAGPPRPKCEIAGRAISVAGTLPDAKHVTIRQSPVRFSPWTSVPASLVTEAYSRSVPTAVAGFTPKNNTRIGVISAPPPIPVCPTSGPAKNPESMKRGSTNENRVIRRRQSARRGRVTFRP